MSNQYMCALCQKPVALENIKTDENGQPVHEDCYAQTLAPSSEKTESETVKLS
jgi:hypothetical protein